MSKNSERKARRYGTNGKGMNNAPARETRELGLPSGETTEHKEQSMRRKSSKVHRSHHKYDESKYQTDYAALAAQHLIGG